MHSMRSIRMGIGHRYLLLVSLGLLLLVTTAHAAAAATIIQQGMDGVGSMTRTSMVGSAPPNCEGKCGWWCVGSSCEAVLVPIEPPQKQDNKQIISRRHGSGGGGDDSSSARASAAQRRPSYDDDGDHAEYKPVTWTCKCV